MTTRHAVSAALALISSTYRRHMFVAMRTARPTADLARARHFYEVLVGLPVLGSFAAHDGFDGVIFGLPDERAQLELVSTPHGIIPRPSAEDALVLYCDLTASTKIALRLREALVPELQSDATDLNPYWPRNGALTFVDPDGYRLIVALT